MIRATGCSAVKQAGSRRTSSGGMPGEILRLRKPDNGVIGADRTGEAEEELRVSLQVHQQPSRVAQLKAFALGLVLMDLCLQWRRSTSRLDWWRLARADESISAIRCESPVNSAAGSTRVGAGSSSLLGGRPN